ncbi:MAG: hypothetical protein BroJett018_50490 [Chloroflexota bacterium]|nr:MAG: hypothetical protein BroJett018_50490 [Chloroflexota bacterium]
MNMRWIRWLGGLFGTLWLLITAVLWTGRPADGRLQDVLLSTTTSTGYSYARATVGDVKARQLTPLDKGYVFVGATLDWGAIFLVDISTSSNPMQSTFDLYWLSLPDQQWQVVGAVSTDPLYGNKYILFYWTPDHRWGVYPLRHGNTVDLMAIRADGQQVVNLTNGTVTGIRFDSVYPIVFSSDSQWVYFHGISGQQQHVYRVRLDGSDVQDIIYKIEDTVVLNYHDTENNLFVIFDRGPTTPGIVRIASDGTDLHLLGAPGGPVGYGMAYLPSHKLLITHNNLLLTAVRVTDGKLMWSYETGWINKVFVSEDENSLYFFLYGPKVKRIRWDGTGLTTLYPLTPSQQPVSIDPDDETLLYVETHNDAGPYEIWRRRRGESPQKLATFAEGIRQQVTPKENWLVFTHYSRPFPSLYRIHPDGTGLERILNGPSEWNDVVAFGPKWELKWQPLIHAIFGTALLIISLLRLPPKWRKSKRWPLLNSVRRL